MYFCQHSEYNLQKNMQQKQKQMSGCTEQVKVSILDL